MEPLLFLVWIVSFFITVYILPKWIIKAKTIGLVGKDMNKIDRPKAAEGGGLIPLLGFILGVLFYIALITFYFKSTENTVEIFALTTSILILGGIGIIDDLLGWKKGLSKKFRLGLCVFAAIPLMVINAGISKVNIPFIDGTELGLLYPLLLIPLGIVATSTTFNFLAGYNGLEASQGILILSALSLVSYLTGSSWLAIIGFTMVTALIGFWIINKYPAKVFPGDSITYPIGGLIAIMAILGNFERIAVFFFIPYILEFGLKVRGGLKKQSFGKPIKEGKLDMPYNKIYGLEHLSIWVLKKFNKNTEKNVVWLINAFQLLVIILGFIIFRQYVFS